MILEALKANTFSKKILTVFIVVTSAVLFTYIFSSLVPYHMDEFSLYHRIICEHYPDNSLNTFRVSCQEWNLTLPFSNITLPLREYAYMGSITSAYYYPIFKIWTDPISARFMGLIFLFIQALILARIFKRKIFTVFIGLIIFFPYFFQHIIDTGVVAFQITCFFSIYYFLNLWFNEPKVKWLIFMAIFSFLGLWAKLSFSWIMVGLGLTTLFLVWEHRHRIFQKNNERGETNKLNLKKIITHSIIVIGLFSILSGTLLFSTNNNGEFYYKQLFTKNRSLIDTAKYFHPKIIANSEVLKSFVNPLQSTQKNFEVTNILWFSIIYPLGIYLITPISLLLIYIKNRRSILNLYFQKSLGFSIIFGIVLTVIYVTPGARLMHHAVIVLPFMILSFGYMVKYINDQKKKYIFYFKPEITQIWIIFFIAANVFLFLSFQNQPIKKINDPSIKTVNHILSDETLAKNYFYVAVDWGIYYYQGLYGPKQQSVLYIEPLNDESKLDTLRQLGHDHNRSLLFIMMRDPDFIITLPEERSDTRFIIKSLGLSECKLISKNSVWTIWLETTKSQNICI